MKYKNVLINHKTFSNSLLESFYALKMSKADNVFLVFVLKNILFYYTVKTFSCYTSFVKNT